MGLKSSREVPPDQLGQFLVPEDASKTGGSTKPDGNQPPVA
jgi:hypothetical protein